MPRAEQCCYREGRSRCRRNGTGNPPLCRPHRLVLEQAQPTSVGEKLGTVVGRLFRGERITRDDLAGAFVDGLQMMGATTAQAEAAARGRMPTPGGVEHRGRGRSPIDWAYEQLQRRAAEARARAAPAAKPEGPDPRLALGWKKGQVVTVEDVTRRRRELAKKYHPDRPGGSVTKMQAVNAAADQLLAELENPGRS